MMNEYFECQCSSDEHRLVFRTDFEPLDEPVFYVSAFLRDWRPWYMRVWNALKYVFGIHVEYGHFDTCMVRPEDAIRLKLLCTEFINANERWQHKNGFIASETTGITG